MMKKILVALDESESAEKAFDYALDLADKYAADLEVLTVFHVDPRVYTFLPSVQGEIPVSVAAMDQYVTRLKASHKQVLFKALNRAKRRAPDVKVSARLVEGRPADKIVKVAEHGKFDVIVMGSRGVGGVKGFVLGSVSDRVADHAPCPVLIVKCSRLSQE
jgi:nucleotide-binding universal stress UspA family protein